MVERCVGDVVRCGWNWASLMKCDTRPCASAIATKHRAAAKYDIILTVEPARMRTPCSQ